MNRRTTSVVAYFTWLGYVIALFAGDREGAKFHLNQALIILAASTLDGYIAKLIGLVIPVVEISYVVEILLGLFCFVCWVMGVYYAILQEEKEVPLLGKIRLIR